MNEHDEKYLLWKDKKTEPFRKIWIESLMEHERLVKRYYDIFNRYLSRDASHDQLVNARHDREAASSEAYIARRYYEEALAHFNVDKYLEETGGEK